jgi:hypothetical protein
MFCKCTRKTGLSPFKLSTFKDSTGERRTIPKILQMENTKYVLKDYHGGGKTTSKNVTTTKIVIQKLLQKNI